jgi:hypothetical protein
VRAILCSVCVCVSLAGSVLQAGEWHVYPDGSGDAPTIGAAADSAASGDIIYIHQGTYAEEGILFDDKDVICVTPDGRVYLVAPIEGSGTCLTIRSASSAFILTSIYVQGFDVGISLEDASPALQFITVGDCGTGMSIGGLSSPFFGYSIVDSCGAAIVVTDGDGTALQNLTIVGCTTGISVTGGNVTIERDIICGCGSGIVCSGAAVSLICNDLHANTVDYDGCAAGTTDFFLDPVFCFYTPPSSNPYMLHVDSPCTASNSPCGVFLGFNGTPVCSGQAVDRSTWGEIKSLYR